MSLVHLPTKKREKNICLIRYILNNDVMKLMFLSTAKLTSTEEYLQASRQKEIKDF